ncbi:RNA recognition motif domain-containing protein [Ceratobasidium sp. AG-Ba]|nr:RNA recognition motif domain-containing protein [Ceratobasidium sp. AG-Ba]
MSRQTLTGGRGVTKPAMRSPEDRHQQDLRTQNYHDFTHIPPCGKQEPDTCPNTPLSERDLHRTLYVGSARPDPDPAYSSEATTMAQDRRNYPSSDRQDHWSTEQMHQSQQQSSPQQHMFPAYTQSNANAQVQPRRMKKSAPTAKRLVVQDFQALVHCPQKYHETLHDYVGADSRYTLAGVHAGIFVRQCTNSTDTLNRLKQAHTALAIILDFFSFVHSIPKGDLKPEQKGCFTLRVCYCALTALLGDFSTSSETPPSDPHAPILSRSLLSSFRELYPPIGAILRRLSGEFELSINTYRHRRSPSASVVGKLQGILRTLEVWNQALGDETFIKPTAIIRTWLDNHPAQVDSSRRTRAPSTQSSPCPSEPRVSPAQYDSPMFDYNPGQLHPSPIHGNGLPAVMAGGGYIPHTAPYSPGLFVDTTGAPTYYAAPYDLSGMYNMSDPTMNYRP